MSKEWRHIKWAECCECGDAVEVLTDKDGADGTVGDSDKARCCGCGIIGWTSVDDDDAWINWNIEDEPEETAPTPTP